MRARCSHIESLTNKDNNDESETDFHGGIENVEYGADRRVCRSGDKGKEAMNFFRNARSTGRKLGADDALYADYVEHVYFAWDPNFAGYFNYKKITDNTISLASADGPNSQNAAKHEVGLIKTTSTAKTIEQRKMFEKCKGNYRVDFIESAYNVDCKNCDNYTHCAGYVD